MVSSLGIVLPAYNEEARLGPALDELFGYLCEAVGMLPASVSVLVVDDGSTDGTATLVRGRPEFVAEVGAAAGTDAAAGTGAAAGAGTGATNAAAAPGRPGCPILGLLTVPHGGKGSAVRAGMLAAEGDVLVFADADMATPPQMLPRLVAALESADVALGSRIQLDGSDMRATQPRFRRLVGKLFRFAAQLWVTGPVRDTQCGFKGFTRSAARDLFGQLRITSIVFDVDLIYLARRRGYRIAIVPIIWADRRGSRMQARPMLALRVAWDLVRIRLIHGHVKPVQPTVVDRPADESPGS
jgi:dolichyl-phosphate beta-glucosyltransferase